LIYVEEQTNLKKYRGRRKKSRIVPKEEASPSTMNLSDGSVHEFIHGWNQERTKNETGEERLRERKARNQPRRITCRIGRRGRGRAGGRRAIEWTTTERGARSVGRSVEWCVLLCRKGESDRGKEREKFPRSVPPRRRRQGCGGSDAWGPRSTSSHATYGLPCFLFLLQDGMGMLEIG
jgi:hypothetical protein